MSLPNLWLHGLKLGSAHPPRGRSFRCARRKLQLSDNCISLQLFRILFRTMNYQYDYTFDWTILRQRKQHMEAGAAAADRRSPSVQRRAQQQPSQPPPNNEVTTSHTVCITHMRFYVPSKQYE